jgi:sporulation integral membrane protein YtvI
MNLEKQKAFLIHFLFIALLIGLGYIGIKYFMPLLMPFIIGLIVAAFLRKMIDAISKYTHIKRSFVSIVILLIFYSAIAFLAILAGARIFAFMKENVIKLPTFYREAIEPALYEISEELLSRYPDIEIYFEDIIVNLNDSIFTFATNTSTKVLNMITGFVGQVPSILIKFIITIVATFFFTIDFHRITDFVLRQFSDKQREMILKVKDNIIGTLGKFLKAYTTLIIITFLELSIGFFIMKIPSPFLIGGIVAIVDVLPILGTGAVLLPWMVIAFIFGNNTIGFGMLILYIIITVVRQSLEPKIVGQQIGLHPVVTLTCIFVGAQLLGVVGLLAFPVAATILKKMNDEGTIHLFK